MKCIVEQIIPGNIYIPHPHHKTRNTNHGHDLSLAPIPLKMCRRTQPQLLSIVIHYYMQKSELQPAFDFLGTDASSSLVVGHFVGHFWVYNSPRTKTRPSSLDHILDQVLDQILDQL